MDSIQAPLVVRTIPAGKYAEFTIRGHVQEAVGALWQEIWQMGLERLYSYDFEVYHNNSEDINDQMIDIYISIK
ncbi:MAG: GyrI-like domain-containing protein [Clostridia bacterium]|nr:GyrI-like domain-containing protein [Clostridia bacterium]